jgi:ElaB/YqjD/DUF883 family membrane-anchored ribosome-binding protein
MEMESAVRSETPKPNGKSFSARAFELAQSAFDLGEKALHAKFTVDHALEEGVRATRHAVRKGRDAAEDMVDQAAVYVRRKPLQSIGSVFVCGALFGGATLFAMGRLRRRTG